MSKKLNYLSVLLIAFTLFLSACQEDSPDLLFSTNELEGEWKWESVSESNELDVTCSATVKVSENDNNVIEIHNFQNLDNSAYVEFTISGTSLTMKDTEINNFAITNGFGTIQSAMQTMNFEYTISDGESSEKVTVIMTAGGIISKKAQIK